MGALDGTCLVCKIPFTKNGLRSLTCSRACNQTRLGLRFDCAVCGKPTVAQKVGAKTCSRSCGRMFAARNRAKVADLEARIRKLEAVVEAARGTLTGECSCRPPDGNRLGRTCDECIIRRALEALNAEAAE
jgi:hypothetical protein